MAFGGVVMHVQRSHLFEKCRVDDVASAIVGMVLLVLLAGLWAYLWVPSSPVF